MTIKQALAKHRNVEIEILLSHLLGKSKEFLYLYPQYQLTKLQYSKVLKSIERREKGEPVAHILGYKDFMGHRFKVNKDVLIPRPETEWLVERAIQTVGAGTARLKKGRPMASPTFSRRPTRIFDLGTGSGCIVISLIKAFQTRGILAPRKDSPCFWASDISKKALKVARQNAREHQVKIKFIHSDILQNVRMSFDIIIANLPYVAINDYRKLKTGLIFEPKRALTDGTNHWAVYERFFKELPKHISPGAVILMEIDPKSKIKLSAYIKKYLPRTQNTPSVSSWVRGLPASKIKFHKDFNGLWRYMEIKN